MARQVKTKRVETTDLQGEGSYVVLRSPKWGLLRKAQKQAASSGDAAAGMTFADELLVKSVLDWNWTDDDGQPLALPKDAPAVLDDLDSDEVAFLIEKITGAFTETSNQGN